MNAENYWSRIAARRLRRRSALGLAGAGASAAFLAACGGSSTSKSNAPANNAAPQAPASGAATATPNTRQGSISTATPATGAQPQRGGTFNGAAMQQFGNLHPQEAGGSTGFTLLYVYDHLVNSDYQHGTLDLSAAASVEQPSPLQFVFKIRPESKFQSIAPVNGRAVTSGDVVASWQSFVADAKGLGAKTAVQPLLNGLQTPDDATLIVNQQTPNVWTLGPHGLAAPIPTAILPKELLGSDTAQKQAIGSGGFVLDQFDPASTISFKRRPDGWHADRPYLDGAAYKVITDTTAQAAALKAKQIDSLAARDKLQADEFKSYGKDMQIDTQLSYPRMMFMRADAPPFNDDRMRQAIYVGLNIQELIDKVELGQGEWSGPVPPYLTEWSLPKDELQKVFPFDLKTAKQLLAAAGWDSSQEIEQKYPQREKTQTLNEIVQQQLAAIGIKTKLVPQDPITVWQAQTINSKGFVLAATDAWWLGQDPDIWLRYFGLPEGAGTGQAGGWASTPEIQALIKQQATIADHNQQKPVILDAERKLLAAYCSTINLYSPYIFTGRWSYFHPVNDRGYAGVYGHYEWMEKKT
jgi:peptide/nickel transport system substrate-binding protein